MAELDNLDRQIFEQLAQNGRMSNLDVARLVGVSEKTVRLRIRRLIERDGMRVAATLDRAPAPSQLIVLLHAEPGQRFSVATRLAALAEVDEIHLTTGAYELIMQASFASDAEAVEFLVRHVESAPGVQSAQSTHVIETINRRAEPAHDPFADFDAKATGLHEMNALFDLTCDVATAHLGTNRIAVSSLEIGDLDPTDPVSTSKMRWRGLSSRYIEMLQTVRRSESVIIPNVIERGQHLFVPDAQTDPLFRPLLDLVAAEGFHSLLAVPVRSNDVWHGTMTLYYDTVIPYRADLIALAQELADLLGMHVARCLQEQIRTPPASGYPLPNPVL